MPFFTGSIGADAIEEYLTDACQIWTPVTDGEGVLDLATFEVTFPEPVYLWEGPCLYQPAASSVEAQAGGGGVRVVEDKVKLPAGSAGFRVGDAVRIRSTSELFEIVRIERRSHEMSTTLRVRSRRDAPAPL